jgi:hypothetical protein
VTTEVVPSQLTSVLNELLWKPLVKAGLAKLFAAVPFLGWGPIGWAVTLVVNLFAEKLFEAVRLAIDLQAIVLLNEEHRKAFDKASVVLKIVGTEKGIESDEFENQRQLAEDAMDKFVSHIGR